jgi:photosystem II stability/assembly factor-like uncharacterized protein
MRPGPPAPSKEELVAATLPRFVSTEVSDMNRFLRRLPRQAVVATLALVMIVPVLADSAEPAAQMPGLAARAGASAGSAAGPAGSIAPAPPGAPASRATAAAVVVNSAAAVDALAGLEFRNIGPAIMGGRVSDLAVVDDNPAVFYVGVASGGVWKTTNFGTTFEPVFDDQSTASIGDVTVSQQNPSLVWVGSGEPNNRQSSPWGNGVYKSLDGGRNWQHMGLQETRHIGRILIDPTDNDTVFVAAVGHLWGPNPERGVFRTRDGGRSWEKVLFVDEDTGVSDLAMDPQDPGTLFAAAYQRRRTAHGFSGGGPGSGIFRSMDGGETWERLSEGLPSGEMGRIGLDIYRRDGNLVYAIVEAGGGRQGVYRSTDRGDSWEHLSTTNNRPMYYSQIRVDPSDPDRIYAGGSDLWMSTDGGRNFANDAAEGVHLDHHAIWIDPNNSDNIVIAGDGGISFSFDRTRTWRQLRNLVISQFYEIGVDMRDPYYVCGGLQDNGSWCGPSNTLSRLGIRNRDWYNIGSGDGFYARIDPTDPNVVYAESQGGNITRVDLATGERQRIRPLPRAQGRGPESGDEVDYEWNWNTPFLISEHDNQVIYVGSSHLLKSPDRGISWEAMSPDVTTGVDRDQLPIMGRLVERGTTLSAHDGISGYGNLMTISESPLNPNVLYVGTDDGNIQGTRDGGASWRLLSQDMPGLTEPHTVVSRVVASRHDESTVYATLDAHERDDYRPYAYRSDDYGATWEPIVAGLPDGWSINVITEHPRNGNLLFLGNEVGVFVSIDRGATWAQLKNNLPTVPVDDIVIHPRENDLVLGTHGRGIWILDDITPLEELSEAILAANVHMFSARRAMLYNIYSPQEWSPGIWRAPNPPEGAMIRYYLRQDVPLPRPAGGARRGGGGRGGQFGGFGGRGGGNQTPPPPPPAPPEPTVTLTVLDAGGELVREFEGPGRSGVQQAIWDLRIQDAYDTGDGGGGRGGGRGGGGSRGPRVLPGTYTVRLEAGGRTVETEVEVVLDPRVQISQEALDARQDALMDAYHLARPLYEAQQAASAIDDQLAALQEAAGENAPSALTTAFGEAGREMRDIRQQLQQAGGGGGAANAIQSFTGPPTEDQLWQIDEAWRVLPDAIVALNRVITDRLPGLMVMVYQPGIGPEPPATVEVPSRPQR